MASKPIDGVGLGVVVIGSVLVYAGAKGYSVLAVIQNLIKGQPVATNVALTNPLTLPGTESFGSAPVAATGSNQSIGQQLAVSYGWSGVEWDALRQLWEHESGWNNHADNPSSHAYGIPQALPLTKMPKAAWPETEGGTSDANAQISWGLAYIKQRYGTPSAAWAFWNAQNPHWY
jgi:hypothetical protein